MAHASLITGLRLEAGDERGRASFVKTWQRGNFEPVTDMVGGGPFGLEPAQWTDDTSMALSLAARLIDTGGFAPDDQMNRYCRWRDPEKAVEYSGLSSRTTHGAEECVHENPHDTWVFRRRHARLPRRTRVLLQRLRGPLVMTARPQGRFAKPHRNCLLFIELHGQNHDFEARKPPKTGLFVTTNGLFVPERMYS